jgi:hypothetical protein
MSSISPESNLKWQEIDHRITSDGLDLTIRREADEGQMEVLVFDGNGSTEMILPTDRALEVFAHPNVTPGIRVGIDDNPWDRALDAYNDLEPEDKFWAERQVQRDVDKGFFAPTLILDAVRRQKRDKDLREAA